MIHAKNWMNPIKFSLLISMVWMAALSSTVQAATDIEFETLDGKTVKLSDFRGKWVVVNYWATWCPPCRVEMPELGFSMMRIKIKMPSFWA